MLLVGVLDLVPLRLGRGVDEVAIRVAPVSGLDGLVVDVLGDGDEAPRRIEDPLRLDPREVLVEGPFAWIGLVPLAAGIGLLFWCIRDFYVVGKGTLAPWQPPKRLVTTNLYRFSRNPMYVGLTTLYLGLAAVFNLGWPVLFLPLVLWSLSLYSTHIAIFQECSHYAINVLSVGQTELAKRFATSGIDKFAGLSVEIGASGVPLLPGSAAWFECRNEMRHAGGDHVIFIGRVERFHRSELEPLGFLGGKYKRLADY